MGNVGPQELPVGDPKGGQGTQGCPQRGRQDCRVVTVRAPLAPPPRYLIVKRRHHGPVLRLPQEPRQDLGAKVTINQPGAAQLRGPGLVGPEAPHGLTEGPGRGAQGHPKGPRHPGDPTLGVGGVSPLVVVVAVPLGVVFAPHVHHDVALGQQLGVPGAQNLGVLWGG